MISVVVDLDVFHGTIYTEKKTDDLMKIVLVIGTLC